jgi:hypothetical protein
MKRSIGAIFVAAATFVISFVLTNILYIKLADWRDPDPSAMAAMGAIILGLVIGPICALIAGAVVFWWPNKDSASK